MSPIIVIDPLSPDRTAEEIADHIVALRAMKRLILGSTLDAEGLRSVSSAVIALENEGALPG